jgi:hypothetical protein
MMTTSVTLNVYSHMIAGLGEGVATAMEDALRDNPGVGGVGDDEAR